MRSLRVSMVGVYRIDKAEAFNPWKSKGTTTGVCGRLSMCYRAGRPGKVRGMAI
ncbi:MAG TPA: hypothetical protein VFF64_09625 [Candidatus Eremiobacteraceae bacterium]|nr:hypothetical protein [Candidatus Eremiobacteraceae bacterium]